MAGFPLNPTVVMNESGQPIVLPERLEEPLPASAKGMARAKTVPKSGAVAQLRVSQATTTKIACPGCSGYTEKKDDHL